MTEIYEGDSATLDLSGGKVDVTDPCYDRGTWCAKWEMPVKPGVYNVTQSLADCGEWGTRVAALTIEHKDAVPQSVWMLLSGDIGVDAGLCGFFAHKPDFDDEAWRNVCNEIQAIDRTRGNYYHPLYTFIDGGVFSETGYGDGGYDLYCRTDAAGDIVALRTVYIAEEDDEEEEEEVDEDD